jgi:HEPN domain-containing protein
MFLRNKDLDGTMKSSLFHAQQAVEKWLKLLILFSGITPKNTHDLNFLLNTVETQYLGYDFTTLRLAPDNLFLYAVEGRYPAVAITFELMESDCQLAVDAIRDIEEIIVTEIPVIKFKVFEV